MKKRIISLLLVTVMAVLALASCAYSYEKDNMANYATFDKDAFFTALTDASLKITDGDFGTDENKRKEQVSDAIFAALAKAADTDDKKKEGAAGKHDLFYYCYYATVTDDAGKEHVLYASKMNPSSPTNFQLGLFSLEGLDLEIAKAIDGKDVKDFIYSAKTAESGKLNVTAEGDVVYVSYTKEYSQLAFNEDGTPTLGDDGNQITETKKVTVSYERVTVGGAEGTFGHKLLGLEVGKTNTFELTNPNLDSADKKESYSNVKVELIVEGGSEIASVVQKPYTTDKTEKNVYGDSVQLKDKDITYHVFPVYFIDVEDELTASVVVDKFYTELAAHTDEEDGSKTYKFDAVQNGGYKNGEKTLADLVTELADLRVKLSDAEKALESAEKVVADAGDKKTEAQENAVTEAKTKLTEAETNVDAKEAEILAATSATAELSLADALVADMEKYQYNTLLDEYKSTVKQSLAKEIFALAKAKITFKTEENGTPILPWDAVHAAYDRIENGHKYDFYEGSYSGSSSSSSTGSSNTESNYKHYEGDFDEFLKVEYFGAEGAKTATMQDVYNKIGAAAEESVRGVITMYVLREALEEKYSTDLAVTDEQIDEFKETYLYYLFGNSMEESDYVTALLCDNIFDYLLTETEEDNYVADEKYGNLKIQYVNIKYDFK